MGKINKNFFIVLIIIGAIFSRVQSVSCGVRIMACSFTKNIIKLNKSVRRSFIKKEWFEVAWLKIDQNSSIKSTRFKLAKSLEWINSKSSWIRKKHPWIKEVSSELYRLSGHYRYPNIYLNNSKSDDPINGTDYVLADDQLLDVVDLDLSDDSSYEDI